MEDTQTKPRHGAAERKVAERNWAAYVRCREHGHKKYIERADQYNRYYVGEQWDEATLAKLREGNRPAHTINLILSTVNAVMGEYLNRRQQITLKPMTPSANPRTAELLSRVIGQVEEANHSQFNESSMVMDGLVEERGYVDLRIGYDDNVRGEIRETVLDNRDVLLDPGAKEYDPKTWNEVIVTRWWTVDEIEATYGKDKARRLRRAKRGVDVFGTDAVQFESQSFAQDNGQYLEGSVNAPPNDDDYERVQRWRIIDRQYYKLGDAYCFVDPVFGDEREVPQSFTAEARDAFAEQWGLLVYRKVKRMVRWTVSAGDTPLLDEWSPYDRFTVIPYFPYFRRGRPLGLITNLVGPQDLLNKTASQELHVVNTSANSGWIFESGSLVNMTRDELKKVGAQTGLVLEFARGSTPPEKIQPNQIPTGLDRLTDKAGTWFRMISGVSESFLGQPGREISGVALDAKNQGVQVQLEIVFDNLAKTRQMRAEFLVWLIQHFYTEERLLRLVSRDIDGGDEYEDVVVNQFIEASGEIVNDLTLGEYKVVVTSEPLRANADESEFAQLMQLKEAGVIVPDYAVYEVSNLRNKDELTRYAKKIAGMLEPTPEELEEQRLVKQANMQLLMAQAAEMQAKAQERSANIQLLLAKAASEGQKIPAELQKLGAELRLEMERMAQEAQLAREDLAARVKISTEKNAMSTQAAQVSSMTQRVQQAADERRDQRAAMARAAELRLQKLNSDRDLAMRQRELEHERRQAELDGALREREMQHEARMAEREFELKREENAQKMELQKQANEQKMQLAKQAAKAKTAAAKKPAAKKSATKRK